VNVNISTALLGELNIADHICHCGYFKTFSPLPLHLLSSL